MLGVHGVVGPRAMPAVDLEQRLEQGGEELSPLEMVQGKLGIVQVKSSKASQSVATFLNVKVSTITQF